MRPKTIPKNFLVVLVREPNGYHRTMVFPDADLVQFRAGKSVVGQWTVQSSTSGGAVKDVLAHLAGGETNWPVIPVR